MGRVNVPPAQRWRRSLPPLDDGAFHTTAAVYPRGEPPRLPLATANVVPLHAGRTDPLCGDPCSPTEGGIAWCSLPGGAAYLTLPRHGVGAELPVADRVLAYRRPEDADT